MYFISEKEERGQIVWRDMKGIPFSNSGVHLVGQIVWSDMKGIPFRNSGVHLVMIRSFFPCLFPDMRACMPRKNFYELTSPQPKQWMGEREREAIDVDDL